MSFDYFLLPLWEVFVFWAGTVGDGDHCQPWDRRRCSTWHCHIGGGLGAAAGESTEIWYGHGMTVAFKINEKERTRTSKGFVTTACGTDREGDLFSSRHIWRLNVTIWCHFDKKGNIQKLYQVRIQGGGSPPLTLTWTKAHIRRHSLIVPFETLPIFRSCL